jgi:hypothetical protein
MKFRQSQLLAATSIMTAGTKVIDINVKDVISRLVVVVRGTNSTWDPIGHPALIVKQIDLVDGSDVLHSMRGVYSQAVAFYGTKIQPFNYVNYTDNGICNANIPIYFGRELYDPVYALVPEKFNNLQLKIEHNYALGGATPDACTIEVWADIFDEPPAGVLGFLSAKSHWTKTLVQSTTDYVDLPTDHPIRLVMPAAFSNDEEPNINIDSIKLSEEHDKRVLFEMGILEALQMFEQEYPLWSEWGEGRLTANVTNEFFFTPCKDLSLDIEASQDSDAYFTVPWTGGNGRSFNSNVTRTVNIHSQGRSAHGIIPIPMGRLMYPDDWWDTPALGSARIKMITGAGDVASLYELLLQQMRKY